MTLSALAKHSGGIVKPICFGGLEIEDKLELRRLLDWQVSRLGAFENLVHVDCGASKIRSASSAE